MRLFSSSLPKSPDPARPKIVKVSCIYRILKQLSAAVKQQPQSSRPYGQIAIQHAKEQSTYLFHHMRAISTILIHSTFKTLSPNEQTTRLSNQAYDHAPQFEFKLGGRAKLIGYPYEFSKPRTAIPAGQTNRWQNRSAKGAMVFPLWDEPLNDAFIR